LQLPNVSTRILRTTLGSTYFLEAFWRRRDTFNKSPAAQSALEQVPAASKLEK